MSDFYDSLEDERNEDESSCGSLESFQTDLSTGSLKFCGSEPAVARSSLHRGEKSKKSKDGPFSGARRSTAAAEGLRDVRAAIRLPSIVVGNTKNGVDLENESLSKQGLQLNKDGSFTKSPRVELESLPFVAREYRNLQFQKKKTYEMRNRAPSKVVKKTVFTFSSKPRKSVSTTKVINARRIVESSKEVLVSRDSFSSSRESSKEDVQPRLCNDNMTDSMKEDLLKKQTKKIHSLHNFKTFEHIKTVKRATNSVEKYQKPLERVVSVCKQPDIISCRSDSGQHVSISSKALTPGRSRTVHSLFGGQAKGDQRTKFGGKHTNPVSTAGFFRASLFGKALSYSERRQIANGFNPLCLRPGSKKVTSETNRSNFGDSVAERLSEDSTRALSSTENFDDEEEEMFYWNLIEKDKMQKMREGCGTKSEAFLQVSTKNSSTNSKFSKERQQNYVNKPTLKVNRNSKSMSIVLPAESTKLNKESKTKQSHYCLTESSTLSKAELANKARAYGYLVNARNIFKMKNSKGLKADDKGNNGTALSSCPTAVKKKETSENWSLQGRTSKEGSQEKKACRASKAVFQSEKSQERGAFVLPLVDTLQRDDSNFTSEILKEISSCLGHSALWSLST